MWREVRLGEVCELKRGYDLPKARRGDGLVPVVSSSGPSGFHTEAKVHAPGVVTGRYGTLGRVFYMQEDFWPLNTALYVRDFKGNEPRFVAALLESMELARHDGAAAVPGLNRNQLHELPVRLPDQRSQAVIGSVLGALDELVDNYRRRVEVLEEMARAIYREWFVHFRYPGHASATFAAGPLGILPESWEICTIGDVLELRYGKPLKQEDRRGGRVAVVGSSGIVGWHDEELVPGPSIVVGRKGNVGSITWVDGGAWPIDTTYFVCTDLPLRYVVEQLRDTEFLNTHAAVPGLSRSLAYGKPFLLPPATVMGAYGHASEPLAGEARVLRAQAQRVGLIRDLLLPKLVTGQIDVSSLDVDAEAEESVA